uniref:Uncharacterized protein n=1 Tax=viral metagenome TaxID=1070528 RepID=A0A6C0KXJ8_9ZZZZ
MSSFIVLSAKGDSKAGMLPAGDIEQGLSKVLKRAKAPALIGSWPWQKLTLSLYGYKEGRAGTENKNELPPPHDEVLLFGDACIVAKSGSAVTSFTVEQYKKFYNTKFGGFEDIGDGEEEEEEEEEEDEEEEDFEEDEGADEEDMDDTANHDDEDEEEVDVRPTLRIKSSGGFKKIAKWMSAQELKPEDYPI